MNLMAVIVGCALGIALGELIMTKRDVKAQRRSERIQDEWWDHAHALRKFRREYAREEIR